MRHVDYILVILMIVVCAGATTGSTSPQGTVKRAVAGFRHQATYRAGSRLPTAVYLGNRFLEVGIHPSGSFGVLDQAGHKRPPTFQGTPSTQTYSGYRGIGLAVDPAGFSAHGSTERRSDVVIPGQPEEVWMVGFKKSAKGEYMTQANAGANDHAQVSGGLQDTSSAPRLSASWAGTAGDGCLQVHQVYSIADADSKMVEVDVALRNVCKEELLEVTYVRAMEPDYASRATTTIMDQTAASGGCSRVDVVPEEGSDKAPVAYVSGDPRSFVHAYDTYVELRSAFRGELLAHSQDRGYTDGGAPVDTTIALVFKVGALRSGASTGFKFFIAFDEAEADSVTFPAPHVSIAAMPKTVPEMHTVSILSSVTASAPSSPLTYTVDWGDGSTYSGFNVPDAHRYVAPHAYNWTVAVQDTYHRRTVRKGTINVINVLPQVLAFSLEGHPDSVLDVSKAASVHLEFADPGGVVHVSVVWGDGSSSVRSSLAAPIASPLVLTHAYSATGPFTIVARVEDRYGGRAPEVQLAVQVLSRLL